MTDQLTDIRGDDGKTREGWSGKRNDESVRIGGIRRGTLMKMLMFGNCLNKVL